MSPDGTTAANSPVAAGLAILAVLPAGAIAVNLARRLSGKPVSAAPTLALGAIMTVWAWTVTPGPLLFTETLALGWVLITLGAIDIAVLRLPNVLTLPLAALGLAVSLTLPGRPFLDHLAGAAAAYAVLAVLEWGYRRLRGRAGLGLGDAKLAAAAGAWLGWRPLPSVLLIACLGAMLWLGLRTLIRGRASLKEPLAFGAPLCAAIWWVWLYGPIELGV